MLKQGPIYRFAGFELNPQTAELRTGESRVTLQEKPLRLLLTLLDHAQQVVSREQLRERMWDDRAVIEFDQGINAAIKKLRDALGDSAGQPRFIETVAKKGYRLCVPVTVDAASPPQPVAVMKPARWRHLRWTLPLAAVLAGVVVYVARIAIPAPTEIRSLAVLPLQDLSPEGGHEYLADGVTEEITTSLAQTLQLRVISRTSAMRYKHTRQPVSEIARELGVEAIVEGSVALSGDHVTVTVQLIDALDDRHLWAETYHRRAGDILAVEAEVAQAVASQISVRLNRDRSAPRLATVTSRSGS